MNVGFGSLEDIVQIFDNTQLRERDVAILNTMILAYGQHGKGEKALFYFNRCKRKE